jgi:MFS family permease
MQNIAQSWLEYRLTGSAVLLGSVTFASQIPVFLLATVGGTFADHHNRHHIVIATQTISMLLAFILAALTLTHTVQVWHVFVLASCLGVVNAFDIPTRQAFIPQLVDKEHMINAIALNSTMFNGARIIGPAVAGVLVAMIGEGWCFFANGVSFLAVIAGLLMMKLPAHMPNPQRSSMMVHMTGGLKYVQKTFPVRAVLILLGVTCFVAMPYTVLMPIFADKVLHGGALGYGWLMGATGIGAMFGALLLASKQSIRGLGSWVAIACAGFGMSLIWFMPVLA